VRDVVEISVKGVAGVFISLALLAFLFVSAGNSLTNFGSSLDLNSVSQSGNSLTGYGFDIIVVLVILAFIVVLAYVFKREDE
jgi:ABC-type transport system involved in multi-copper enzyme maturation permease subunit